MAAATVCTLPVLPLSFLAQRTFIRASRGPGSRAENREYKKGNGMSKQTRDWRNQATVDGAMLRADLDRVGLTSGRAVLVHSSLSQVGHVEGGATAVIDALLDIVSPGGTVLFPR